MADSYDHLAGSEQNADSHPDNSHDFSPVTSEGAIRHSGIDSIDNAMDYVANKLTGRSEANRKFYNNTRAGFLNESTPPDEAYTYGGLGDSLKNRRQSDMFNAQQISNHFRGYR